MMNLYTFKKRHLSVWKILRKLRMTYWEERATASRPYKENVVRINPHKK
jgi:hypothetical protein